MTGDHPRGEEDANGRLLAWVAVAVGHPTVRAFRTWRAGASS
jgi:hypothetical protein